jgi:hypothetical protein
MALFCPKLRNVIKAAQGLASTRICPVCPNILNIHYMSHVNHVNVNMSYPYTVMNSKILGQRDKNGSNPVVPTVSTVPKLGKDWDKLGSFGTKTTVCP